MDQAISETGQLASDLWLDQPDALAQIDQRLGVGSITADDAERLHAFTTDGYLTFTLDRPTEHFAELDAQIDDIWRDRPADLSVALLGQRYSFRDVGDERHRRYRIPDAHSHVDRALDLYLDPEVLRLVDLILGQPALPFQSLYFQYGSGQALHRDPMFVPTTPASHLVASWVALEDIVATAGPLQYVPGSHRMPWFGSTVLMPKGDRTDDWRDGWAEYRARMIDQMGLEVRDYCPKQGQVFLWHGGLVHGGAVVTDPGQTRKSFVVHYTSEANYDSRGATMQVRDPAAEGEGWRTVGRSTSNRLERNGRKGLDNPLHGIDA